MISKMHFEGPLPLLVRGGFFGGPSRDFPETSTPRGGVSAPLGVQPAAWPAAWALPPGALPPRPCRLGCRLDPAAWALPPRPWALPPGPCRLRPGPCRQGPAAWALPPGPWALAPAPCRLGPAAWALPPRSCRPAARALPPGPLPRGSWALPPGPCRLSPAALGPGPPGLGRLVWASSLLFSRLFCASVGISRPSKNDKNKVVKSVTQKRP